MKFDNEITLGSEVKCVASGLKGTATTFTVMLSGSRRYGIQPVSENGADLKDAYEIDEETIDVIGAGISARAKPQPKNVPIDVGNEVEDQVTGFKGIVTAMTLFMNGCVLVGVQPKGKHNDAPSAVWVDYKRLKVKSKGVSEDSEKPLKRERTGGPITNMRMRRSV